MNTKETIIEYLSHDLAQIFLSQHDRFWSELQEIRIRIGRPLIAVAAGREHYFDADGNPCDIAYSYIPMRQDIEKTISLISNFSMYAFTEELRGGYITVPGGHRVGLCGRVIAENGIGVKLIRLGLQDIYAHGSSKKYLLKKHGLDAAAVVKAAEELSGRKFDIDEAALASVKEKF